MIFAATLCVVALGGVKTPLQAADPPPVQFIEPEVGLSPIISTTGHINLAWGVPPVTAVTVPTYELQGARSDDFAQPIGYYLGGDERTFLSGLAEGSYFFRVRALDADAADAHRGEWSEVLVVDVDYVDRWKVNLLMLVGLLCLAATVGIIVRGSLRSGGSTKNEF